MTYTPPDPYPYAVNDVDAEWLTWWRSERLSEMQIPGRSWRDYACGYDSGDWVCTLPDGHQCRHVGHLESGTICGLGPAEIPPELRVSEGL